MEVKKKTQYPERKTNHKNYNLYLHNSIKVKKNPHIFV